MTAAGPAAPAAGHLDRHVDLGRPALVGPALRLLRKGAGDPTTRFVDGAWLRAARTPDGPVLARLVSTATGLACRAWGPGREWFCDRLPAFAGADDPVEEFRPSPRHPVLVAAWQRYGGYRIGRTTTVFEALAPACLEQVVTGKESFRAFRLIVTRYGEPAPGPAGDPRSVAYGMRVPPPPEVWAQIPSWGYLAVGVEQRRSRTLVRAATRATALERTLTAAPEVADRALRSLPGVGAWTSAEVRQRSHGDADAWSIGDFHVGGEITYALCGEALDDDACTEVLEPYRGHRFRVQVLVGLSGVRPPRRAPRMSLPTHTPYATRGRS